MCVVLACEHGASVQGPCCRARRARKAVDYSGNAYDDAIRSAIRMQAERGRDPCSRRAAAAMEPM